MDDDYDFIDHSEDEPRDPLVECAQFGRVMTERVRYAAAPIAIARDREVERLVKHFDSARNPSFCLVGESGVGKSAILQDFARRLCSRDERPFHVLETSTSQMLAGTVYIGEWQTRTRDMLRAAGRENGVAVLFTDVFNMMGAGTTSKSDDSIAHLVSPFVEAGELILLGECTPEQFRKGVELHPAFRKLFTVFRVEEQSAETVRTVVETLAARECEDVEIETGTKLVFPPHTLAVLQEYGRLYFPGQSPPGGAVQLLRQVVRRQHDAIDEEATGRTSKQPAERIVDPTGVIDTLETFTGIPRLLLDDSRSMKLGEVKDFFGQRVIGQPSAVEAMVDTITLVKAGLTDPGKPMSVMLFVGPTGVGKTELAKRLAEFIFGSPDRMHRYDMSEFKDYHSFEKLIGNQQARDDSPMHAGSLLAKVRQQPFCVILLDEIEKAHPNVFDLLLQLFDDGRLTDPTGRTTNFTQSIVIMTSNLGGNLSESPFGFQRDEDEARAEAQSEVLEGFFRPEFLNRIDRIVPFAQLDKEDVRIIAQRELGHVLLRSGITRRQLRVDVDPGVIDILVREGFSPIYGARPLKRAVERHALLPIGRKIVGLNANANNALLRLVPHGRNIAVRVVQDRTSRRSDTIARGVRVVDEVRGKSAKLKPTEIERRLTGLAKSIEELETESRNQRLPDLKRDLLAEVNAPDAWDTPARARETLAEFYRTERLLEAIDRVRKRTDDLAARFDTARNGRANARELKAVAERAIDVQRHADLVRFSLRCVDPIDRCDVFVVISTIETELDDDVVGNLADAYLGWSKLKGFETRIVHEDLLDERTTREIVLLVDGVAVYGMLRGEEGIHEFVYGRTQDAPKTTKFVKVRVLPVIDDPAADEARANEIEVTAKRSRGPGLRCKRYKSHVTATHAGSSRSVDCRSELPPDEAAEIVPDLLWAELRRIERDTTGDAPTDATAHEQVTRRYTLRPSASAKDPRTGVVTHDLADLWRGEDLDEFLLATVEWRTKAVATP